MNALVFAAGLGTRLRPLTDNIPKALVPIAGKPLLERVILNLKDAGFTHIVINIHHFGQQIIDFLAANHNFGLHIGISDERDLLLDTGGGIKKAASFFTDGQPFLIHNVDIITDLDLKSFYNRHLKRKSAVSLFIGKRETSRYLLFDNHLKMKGWKNEKTGEIKSPYPSFDAHCYKKYAFNGIHIISPEIISYMADFEGKFSIIDFYLSICDKLDIQGQLAETTGMWLDVGKQEMLQKATAFLINK